MIKYTLNGDTIEVNPQDETQFKIDNPEAQIVEEPGKKSGADQPQATEVNQPQGNQQKNTESNLEDGSSESQSTELIVEDNPGLVSNFESKEKKDNLEKEKKSSLKTEIKNSLEKGPDFIDSTPNEVLSYGNAPEWFNNRANLHEDPRWSDRVRDLVYNGTHGYNPSTGALVKLDEKVDVPEEIKELSEPVISSYLFAEGFDSSPIKLTEKLKTITPNTYEEFEELFGVHEVRSGPRSDRPFGSNTRKYDSDKYYGKDEYKNITHWFNNESNYSKSGLKLNITSNRYGKVELLKPGQEEGSGIKFYMSDPEFYNNVKTQINLMSNPKSKTEVFDYLSDLVSGDLLALDENATGYFPKYRKLFYDSMNVINGTIQTVPFKSKEEEANQKEILNALPANTAESGFGGYTSDGYRDHRVDWTQLSKEEIDKMKKDSNYNFLFTSPINYSGVAFDTNSNSADLINISQEQLDSFYKDPVNKNNITRNLKFIETPKSGRRLPGILGGEYFTYTEDYDEELALSNGEILLPNGDTVSYDWVWANRKDIHNYKSSKQNLSFKENEKQRVYQEQVEKENPGKGEKLGSVNGFSYEEDSSNYKEQLLLNNYKEGAYNSGYITLGYNANADEKILDVTKDIEEFEDNYEGGEPLHQVKEYQELVKKKKDLFDEAGYHEKMRMYDEKGNLIGLKKAWEFNKEKNAWINTETKEEIPVTVDEDAALAFAEKNGKQDLEQMYVDKVIHFNNIVKQMHEQGPDKYLEQFESTFKYAKHHPKFKKVDPIEEAAKNNNIFLGDSPLRLLPQSSKGLAGEYNKALKEMATLYRAMELNINPLLDNTNSWGHELFTHLKRKSVGGNYIIGDDFADSFEQLIKEDGDYAITIDPDKRESTARKWSDTIGKGVVDIGELTVAITYGNKILGLSKIAKIANSAYKAAKAYKKSSKFSKVLMDAAFNGTKTFVEWSAGEALYSSTFHRDIQQTFYWDGDKGEYVIHPFAPFALGGGMTIHQGMRKFIHSKMMKSSKGYRKMNDITPDLFKQFSNTAGAGTTPALLLANGEIANQFLTTGKVNFQNEYDENGNLITPSIFGPEGFKSLAETILTFSAYSVLRGRGNPYYEAAKKDIFKLKGLDANQVKHSKKLKINNKETNEDGIIDSDVIDNSAKKETDKIEKEIKEVEQDLKLTEEQKGNKITELENKKQEIKESTEMLHTYNVINEAKAVARAENKYDDYLLKEFLETDAFNQLRQGIDDMSGEELDLIGSEYGLTPESLAVMYNKLGIKPGSSTAQYYDYVVQQIQVGVNRLNSFGIPKTSKKGKKAREDYLKNVHEVGFNEMKIKELQADSKKNPNNKLKNDTNIKKIKETNKELYEKIDNTENNFHKNFKERLKHENDFLKEVVEGQGEKGEYKYEATNTKKFKENVKKKGGKYDESMGAFISPDGKSIYVDKQKAYNEKSLGKGIHEVGHMLLFNHLKTTNKNGKRVISKEGIATIDYMLDMLPGGRYGKEFLELQEAIDLNYRYEVDVAATKKSIFEGKREYIYRKDKNGNYIENKKEDYYEEYVGKLVEFIKDGKIKPSANLGSRIGRAFYPVLKKTFPKLYKFDINQSNSKKAGKDMMKFVQWLGTMGPTKNVLDVGTGGRGSSGNNIQKSRDINSQISKLKKGSEVIVERNAAMHDILVKRAQEKFGDGWKKILDSGKKEYKTEKKEFIEETSDLRNAIVENNKNVAHWMAAHPKYGGKGGLKGITGDILVGKDKFFEKFENELYELSRTYNPAKNNAVGAYLLQTIKKRYPGIMDQLAPETRTRSLTTEDGKVIDVKDIANYERFEDLNILEIELRKNNKAKLTEEANIEILQSKLRKEIGIQDAQKEKIFDQVKKDLQITKSPIGTTKKSFLTSLKKATENSHYDILDKALTTEKIIELKDVILKPIPVSDLVQLGKFLPQGNIFVKTYSHPTKTKWGAEVDIMEFMGIRPDGSKLFGFRKNFTVNTSGKNLLPEMKSLYDVFSKMPQAEQKASPEYKEFKKKQKVGFPKIYERLDVGINEWRAYVEATTKGNRQVAEKSGTKTNNRNNIIRKMSTSLTKDAIPELLETNKDFVDRYMDVKGLKENIEAKALVEKFINDIGRQQGLQFSKNIQFGASEKQRLWDIIETSMGDFHRVFDIKVLEKNKAHLALTKDYKDKLSVAEADMILDLFLKNKINDIGYILEKINQKIKPGDTRNKGAGEQWGINRMFKIRELTGMEIDFIREQTEVGDAADIQGKILEGYKGQPGISFNIEYKLSAQGSQYGSISGSMKKEGNKYVISTVNARTGINKLDAYSKENRKKIEQLLKDVIPGHKIMVKKLNDLGKMDLDWTKEERQSLLDYKNIGDLYPNRVHTDFIIKPGINGKSILNGLETIGKFTETIIEDHYINEKLFLGKEPSRHIILGDALYHIGQNVLGTNTTQVTGIFSGGFRGIKASQYKTVNKVKSKTGLVSLSLRFHPFKPLITSKPKARITTDLDLQKIFTKEGYEALKAKQAAKAQGQASRNIKNVIDYANGKKKAQGGSVFDFDHTVAVTKSGVKARVPNTDGKPKPKRKVIFLAGGAGSGKGNVIKKLNLEKDGFKIVNQDISLEWLKKNHGLPENMLDLTSEQRSALGKLSHQARQIAKNKMMKYKGNADGVVVDGTGGSVKAMEKLIKEFKDKGYDTSMLFVETSLDVALARNKARKERSLLDKIVERNHDAVQKNKSPFKEMFGEGFMEVKTDKLTMESPMPKELVSKMGEFVKGYENMRLDAEQFASKGEAIKKKGGEFDFSEFNKVVDGKPGPFLEKLRERVKEYGNKDVFILTARPAQSAFAIKEFLKEQGIEIPIENITGLANSTGAAKAKWMLEKYAEGYNDLYFVDDALQNVKAVKEVLGRLDIKSKVVQAKLKFSKDINKTFNEIIERKSKGKFKADRNMSLAEAKALGKSKGRFDFFVPASAEDLKGLMYKLLGKGRQGDADMRFFKKAIFEPFAKGTRDLTIVKQKMSEEYATLKKKSKNIKLNENVKGTPYTVDTAIRMYLWGKAGYEVSDIGKLEKKQLVDYVKARPELISFAETLGSISRVKEGYEKPGEYWMVENIGADLNNITSNRARKDFLHEWIENKNIVFSPENLNKLEASFGKSYREALENMLTRMEKGTNRLHGIKDGPTKWWYDWVNGSVGATMFWNTRSAMLQTISMANFTNHAENNIFAQGRNFANQKQFWGDFAMLYNSPMLKQRRAGLEIDVSASEIQNMFSSSGRDPRSILRYMLEKGFTPTRMADSFAIAMGGSSFYRQRFKMYKKQGFSDVKAKEKAMLDFQEIAEETQQSSRPDLISQQQAGPLGRLILAWQNTPMQMTRLMKKSLSDLVNRRRIENQSQLQSDMSNVSRILYYGAIQNIWFGTLQSGLAWLMFGSDQDDDKMKDKERSVLNGAFDTLLRGTGIYGATISTIKNTFLKYKEEKSNPFWKQDFGNVAVEAINLSPPIGSKVRKVYSAIKGWGKYDSAAIGAEMGLRVDNPELMNVANIIEAATNIPLARLLNKSSNLEEAITGNHEWWQRVAMSAGWSRWNVGVKDEEVEAARDKIKEDKQEKKKIEKEKEKEEKKIAEEKEKKEKGIKTVRCSGTRSNGEKCGNTTETADKTYLCYHHAEFTDGMDRDNDGIKEYRCTATKKDGNRCKNKTENKNKKCYAHQ